MKVDKLMCPLRRWCGLCAPPSAHSMHWLLSPPSTCHPTLPSLEQRCADARKAGPKFFNGILLKSQPFDTMKPIFSISKER